MLMYSHYYVPPLGHGRVPNLREALKIHFHKLHEKNHLCYRTKQPSNIKVM